MSTHQSGLVNKVERDGDGGPSAGGGIRLERWIILSFVGGVLVLTTSIARVFGLVPEEVAKIPAFVGAIVLGLGLLRSAFEEIREGQPGTWSLASLAIIAALALGRYEAAGYVAFILLVFDHALRRTAWGARRAIEELVQLTPDTARIVGEDGQERDADLSEVRVGTIVRVRPGENLPVDGVVTKGSSSINQASLTGEAMPVDVQPGANVYAGTTNLSGLIELRTTQVGGDTTIGKVASLIQEAEQTKTPKQLLIEQVAGYFVPIALVTFGLVWYLSELDRAVAVLIMASPAALLISSPTAMMASFGAAARLGIMIKQSSDLEAASNIDTVVFDKTGTLTTGNFAVSRLAPADGVEGATLLQAAADAEQHSNHPLAQSIMHTSNKARIAADSGAEAEEVHGKGVRAKTANGEILAGRPSWIKEMNPSVAAEVDRVEAQIEGMSGVHVMRGGKYLGAVGLEDKLRHNSKGVVTQLRDLGVRQIVIMTGDRLSVAKRVGITVGVDKVEAECLPEEKHDIVQGMVGRGLRVLMVGDGINDGPSLAAADVGVAMGLSGSDIATNSAGVALMNDDVGRVPFLISLARRTRSVIAQNIAASVLIAIIGVVIAVATNLPLGVAAIYHFLGDIFVLGNSFRLFRFGEEFSSHESEVKSGGARESSRPGAAAVTRAATA
ncbi:MAG: cadmium-translocating P-type ATPase [Phycisphaeraceae bacterium]|nr:cadmium-translocating P-type ATPase [Phycisphaerales bacterium]MCB9842169.1 cadmium-translocating P-type ATPase [Phycisphaeraceae bacterium]